MFCVFLVCNVLHWWMKKNIVLGAQIFGQRANIQCKCDFSMEKNRKFILENKKYHIFWRWPFLWRMRKFNLKMIQTQKTACKNLNNLVCFGAAKFWTIREKVNFQYASVCRRTFKG